MRVSQCFSCLRKEVDHLLGKKEDRGAKDAEVNVTIQVEGGIFNGKTPMDRANSFNHTKIADLLRKHGGKTGEELKAEGK